MIRTIIFDFGNVLAFFDHQRAIEKLRPYTTLAPAELMLILYGGELEVAYERGQISTERYFAIVKEDGRLTCDQSIFVDAFVNIFTENTAVTSLVPKLAERYRLLLASNTNEAHCTKFREQFAHVLSHMHHIVVSQEVGSRKPQRLYFEHCQRLANAEPGECLFIDDLPSNVHAAEAFGWQGIVLTPGVDLVKRLREYGIVVDL